MRRVGATTWVLTMLAGVAAMMPGAGAAVAGEAGGAEIVPPGTADAAAPAAPAAPASPDRSAPPASPALARIATVGASATHGFFAQTLVEAGGRMQPAVVELADALAAVIRGPVRMSGGGSVFFFRAPDRWGTELMEQALASEPTAVIAVDYLFWFGYGHTGHRPGTDADAAARLARMDRGLALLEQVEGPLAIGDVPDMSGAVGTMLSAAQVPAEEVRAALNRRIAAWAAARPDVVLVPLGDLMARLQAGERLGAPGTIPLLKPDRLHPTADGLLVLAREIARAVDAARDDVDESMLELDHDRALERLRVRLAKKLVDAAKPAAEPGASGRPTAPPAADG